MEFERYKNLISHIDIDRSSLEYFKLEDIDELAEFRNDIYTDNDSIELNLIKNKVYKEAVVISLNVRDSRTVSALIRNDQKTFGGSKLFYLNDDFDKILVAAVPRSIEGKLKMVVNRLNKVNEKISRLNAKIKKDNIEMYMRTQGKDKKDIMINMINRNFRV